MTNQGTHARIKNIDAILNSVRKGELARELALQGDHFPQAAKREGEAERKRREAMK